MLTRLALLPYYSWVMSNIKDLTVAQLKRAIEIREQIETLEAQLAGLGGVRLGRPPGVRLGRPPGTGGRRRMSAAGRAAISAAAKARWAKFRRAGSGNGAVKAKVGKRKRFDAATRARLSASAKARWAKAKAAGKSSL